MTIYNVLVEYANFEDEDSNYSEIVGSFLNEDEAIEKIKKEVQYQIENDMKLYIHEDGELFVEDRLIKYGYVAMEQIAGYGEAKIILSEDTIENTDHLKEAVKIEYAYVIDDILNDDDEDESNKEYVSSLTEAQKEKDIERIMSDTELLSGIRNLIVQYLWH